MISQEFTTIVSLASGIVAIFALIKLIITPLDQIKQNKKERMSHDILSFFVLTVGFEPTTPTMSR